MLAGLLGYMVRQVLLNSDQVILKCQNKLHLVILSVCSGKNPHNIALWYSMLCSMYNTCCRFLNSAKPSMPCTAILLKIIHSICFFYCIVNCTSQCKLVVLFSWWSFKSLVIFFCCTDASWFCKTRPSCFRHWRNAWGQCCFHLHCD